jgi:hypothetical protein
VHRHTVCPPERMDLEEARGCRRSKITRNKEYSKQKVSKTEGAIHADSEKSRGHRRTVHVDGKATQRQGCT